MIRLLTIALLVSISPYCFGDEPSKQHNSGELDYKTLLKRIDQLEKRIAELENLQVAQPSVATRTPQIPNDNFYQAPIPPNPGPHATVPPAYGTPQRLAPIPHENVPQGWQLFNFNGQWFYIVPIENAQSASSHRSP